MIVAGWLARVSEMTMWLRDVGILIAVAGCMAVAGGSGFLMPSRVVAIVVPDAVTAAAESARVRVWVTAIYGILFLAGIATLAWLTHSAANRGGH